MFSPTREDSVLVFDKRAAVFGSYWMKWTMLRSISLNGIVELLCFITVSVVLNLQDFCIHQLFSIWRSFSSPLSEVLSTWCAVGPNWDYGVWHRKLRALLLSSKHQDWFVAAELGTEAKCVYRALLNTAAYGFPFTCEVITVARDRWINLDNMLQWLLNFCFHLVCSVTVQCVMMNVGLITEWFVPIWAFSFGQLFARRRLQVAQSKDLQRPVWKHHALNGWEVRRWDRGISLYCSPAGGSASIWDASMLFWVASFAEKKVFVITR